MDSIQWMARSKFLVVMNVNCLVDVVSFPVRYNDPQIGISGILVFFVDTDCYENDISATLSSQRNFQQFLVFGATAEVNHPVTDTGRCLDEGCLGADIFISYGHFSHFTEALGVGDWQN